MEDHARVGWASPGCPDNEGSRIGGPRRFRHHIRRSLRCTCPPSSRLVCGFPRDRCLKNPKHQRHWTLSVPYGVAVIRCLRITPAGECRWCMRDGPGWGQRAAEETFGIDQFFRSRVTSYKCGRAAPGLKEVRGDTFLGCDPDRHYNRASARVCYPGTTEAGRVGGRGNVRICANCRGTVRSL